MEWQRTLELRRYDDTPKLTNPRLQQRWKRYRLSDGSLEYEWRDVPLVWDRENGRAEGDHNE